jgi:hypothetical protein
MFAMKKAFPVRGFEFRTLKTMRFLGSELSFDAAHHT